jgi:predicted metal-dependent peptidase
MVSQEMRLKKAHVALMKHPETSLYSGVILMGSSSVEKGIPTAFTDGLNKKYGEEFISNLTDAELRGLVLHENLHVALKHTLRFRKEFMQDRMLVNVATDYAVNSVIKNLDDSSFCELPQGGLYDEKFKNWSAREIYNYLKQNLPPQPEVKISKSKGENGEDKITISIDGKKYEVSASDEHDFSGGGEEMSAAEQAQMSDAIDRALREGGILAGRMGAKLPRAITEMLEPKVDWKETLRDFVTSSTRGSDEFTWRKFNKRMVANDYYLPSLENESVGELIIAIDTSGSIGGAELNEFATELASICENVSPEKVRVLWWDTEVHGEQVFMDNYTGIAHMLKPQGGGGTRVSCVSDYLIKQKVTAEGVLVFTDGYVESDIDWRVSCPTLWLVTQNKSFNPPVGKMVYKDE